MTTFQLISNLNVISRIRKFMKIIEEGTDILLICQFYFVFSVFLVSDRVVVASKYIDDG
jgi:HSP90 family molecular chaperone